MRYKPKSTAALHIALGGLPPASLSRPPLRLFFAVVILIAFHVETCW
jgi:hypothetical protein